MGARVHRRRCPANSSVAGCANRPFASPPHTSVHEVLPPPVPTHRRKNPDTTPATPCVRAPPTRPCSYPWSGSGSTRRACPRVTQRIRLRRYPHHCRSHAALITARTTRPARPKRRLTSSRRNDSPVAAKVRMRPATARGPTRGRTRARRSYSDYPHPNPRKAHVRAAHNANLFLAVRNQSWCFRPSLYQPYLLSKCEHWVSPSSCTLS